MIEKVESADGVIWLDEVQYTKGGWTNRNKLHDGSWLTVPVQRDTDGLSINRVHIGEKPKWREGMVKTIQQRYGADDICEEILRPYGLLIGLNLALLRIFLPNRNWYFQSHLLGGHADLPISDRLAMMVAELGGTIYLSGPSGRKYLDENPFSDRGIKVDYFSWHGDNPCILEDYSEHE